jgi:hypothetical protein
MAVFAFLPKLKPAEDFLSPRRLNRRRINFNTAKASSIAADISSHYVCGKQKRPFALLDFRNRSGLLNLDITDVQIRIIKASRLTGLQDDRPHYGVCDEIGSDRNIKSQSSICTLAAGVKQSSP